MYRIETLFVKKPKNVLNIYFTAGFPNLEDTTTIIESLEEAGADLIEIGMPYSDPLADGPTIQQSGQIAIKNGMTLPILFEQITAIRPKVAVPLVLMGYFNQVMQYGEARFIQACMDAGVDGLILPDLPIYEYETYFEAMLQEAGLGVSLLITPQTSDERIRKVDELTKGFIYMVSNASITGAKTSISDKLVSYFQRISAMNLLHPQLIGFGISNAETFQTACNYSNGAIIGSAFIKMLSDSTQLKEDIIKIVKDIRG